MLPNIRYTSGPKGPKTAEFPEGTPGELPGFPTPSTPEICYLHPIVNVHPETGRKCLLVPSTAFGVRGLEKRLSREESTQLLDDLCNNACRAPRTYKHKHPP